MTDAVTAEATPMPSLKPSSKASLKARRKRQQAWRERRKARFEAALAMLEALGDDERIEIEPPPKRG